MIHRDRTGLAVGIGLALAVGLMPGLAVAQDEPAMLTEVGEGEGQLSILAWAGYVEDGVAYEGIDWVNDFEAATGCEVTSEPFYTSDEAWTKFETGGYDLVSASGDLSFRLVDSGKVQPVNVDLVPNYVDIVSDLKEQPYNTFDGVHYGIPHGRGANLLMWRTDLVDPPPDSWTSVFDPASPYAGKITAYDAAIYLADAAVALKALKPELGIGDPYALDAAQFAEVVALAKAQFPLISEYWTDLYAEMDAFRSGDSVLGTTFQITTNYLLLEEPPVPVTNIKPKEGSTGWSDTWMIAADTPNINCAYKWLDHITSAQVQAELTEWWGEAPANGKACDLMIDPGFCEAFHALAGDPWWDDVYYWITPRAECVDGSGRECVGFDEWLDAWIEVRAG